MASLKSHYVVPRGRLNPPKAQRQAQREPKRFKSCQSVVSSAKLLASTILISRPASGVADVPNISDHDTESSAEADEDDPPKSGATTPLTPISSKASPHYPSDLSKCHHCPYDGCKKSFNRPAKLGQHIRSHTNTRPFICPHTLCTKDFLRESHLKHHIKSAHSNVRDYVCEKDVCGKSFVTATRLKRHMAAHEGREKHRCTMAGCGQTFRKHGTLQKHVITVHEGRKPFICEMLDDGGNQCGAGFDTEGQLKSHAGRIHGTKRYVCMICSSDGQGAAMEPDCGLRCASFSTHATLRAHMESEHPPTCTECGHECKSQRDLRSHVEVIHGGTNLDESMTHFCTEPGCGRGFTKEGNLRLHVQIIHTSKRFVCGVIDLNTLPEVAHGNRVRPCGKALNTQPELDEHVRTIHQETEPSQCSGKPEKRRLPNKLGRKNHVSVLAKLTGSGYEEESGRSIHCLIAGCKHCFLREYDLEIHLQSRHGLADLEIQEMLNEKELSYSQTPFLSHSTYATDQDAEAEIALDMQYSETAGGAGVDNSLEAGASQDVSFWLDGRSLQTEDDDGECQRLIRRNRAIGNPEKSDGQKVDMTLIDPDLT